jgi:hypothetical protein
MQVDNFPKFCKNCSTKLLEGKQFCHNCGICILAGEIKLKTNLA